MLPLHPSLFSGGAVVMVVAVDALLLLRIFALYNRNKRGTSHLTYEPVILTQTLPVFVLLLTLVLSK